MTTQEKLTELREAATAAAEQTHVPVLERVFRALASLAADEADEIERDERNAELDEPTKPGANER